MEFAQYKCNIIIIIIISMYTRTYMYTRDDDDARTGVVFADFGFVVAKT